MLRRQPMPACCPCTRGWAAARGTHALQTSRGNRWCHCSTGLLRCCRARGVGGHGIARRQGQMHTCRQRTQASAATRKVPSRKPLQNIRDYSHRLFKQVLICQGVRSGLSIWPRHVGTGLGYNLVVPDLYYDSPLVHNPVDPAGQPVGPAHIPAHARTEQHAASKGGPIVGTWWVGWGVGGVWGWVGRGGGGGMFGGSSLPCCGQAGPPAKATQGQGYRESLGNRKIHDREQHPLHELHSATEDGLARRRQLVGGCRGGESGTGAVQCSHGGIHIMSEQADGREVGQATEAQSQRAGMHAGRQQQGRSPLPFLSRQASGSSSALYAQGLFDQQEEETLSLVMTTVA